MMVAMTFVRFVLRNWFLSLAAFTMLVASQTVTAQLNVVDIAITPQAPTREVFLNATIDFRVPGQSCQYSASTIVNGNTVRTTIAITDCEALPPAFNPPLHISPEFGPLPPGAYTYQVYFTYLSSPPRFAAQQGFAVAAGPPIPTLEHAALAALALILAGAGLLLIR
jgi:hypothetical protein